MTSHNIYNYPATSAKDSKAVPRELATEDGFVNFFQSHMSSGNFTVTATKNYSKDDPSKQTSTTLSITHTEGRGQSPNEARLAIRAVDVKLSGRLTTYKSGVPMTVGLDMKNVMQVFEDAKNMLFIHYGKDGASTLDGAAEYIYKQAGLFTGKSDTEIDFSGSLFTSICKKAGLSGSDDAMADGAAKAGVLRQLAAGDSTLIRTLVDAKLIKQSQVQDLRMKAGEHYIVFTPADGEDKAKIRFAKKTDGKVGRKVKSTFHEYRKLADFFYDHSTDASGNAIPVLEKKAPTAPKVGIIAAARAQHTRPERSDEEKAALDKLAKLGVKVNGAGGNKGGISQKKALELAAALSKME